MRDPFCWVAQQLPDSGDCDGQLIRAHLIPRQLLRREGFARYADDPRSYAWVCGGPTGIGGHHGKLDQARTARPGRHHLPAGVEALARELDGQCDGRMPFAAYLDRTYGHASPEPGP